MSKHCQVTVDISEKDARFDITRQQWDDAGNPLPDMTDEEFQKLYDSVKGKTRFYIDLTANGLRRSIRSPLASSKDREFVLCRLVTEIIGQSISKQFDNLSK